VNTPSIAGAMFGRAFTTGDCKRRDQRRRQNAAAALLAQSGAHRKVHPRSPSRGPTSRRQRFAASSSLEPGVNARPSIDRIDHRGRREQNTSGRPNSAETRWLAAAVGANASTDLAPMHYT